MNLKKIYPLILSALSLSVILTESLLLATSYSPACTQEVQQLIREAQKTGKHITIVGAGKGNSVKSTQCDTYELKQNQMNHIIALNLKDKKITVQPGILWSTIQECINPFGLSIAAMQSYSDFSVGGTIGVNAHGQDFRFAPIAQTIDSMVIVDAHGNLKRVSSTENSELFRLIIGGYGLFGVIVEVTIHLIDNTMLEKKVMIEYTSDILSHSQKNLDRDDIALYSARFDMGKEHFMDRMISITYTNTHEITHAPLSSTKKIETANNYMINILFNLTRQYKFLRNKRFAFECNFFEKLCTKYTRNNAMYHQTGTLSHTDNTKIEILQEYFIPLQNMKAFIRQAKAILIHNKVDVLNCTLRYVKKDTISYLPYAPETVGAFVFYYSIDNKKQGFDDAQKWTQQLVNSALDCNGRFYLPYYCFATKEQVRKAYPEFDGFIALKKVYDPNALFINDLYSTYA